MRIYWAFLVCLICAACDSDRDEVRSATNQQADPPGEALTYAECISQADRQTSQAEATMKMMECRKLPDAPAPAEPPGGIPPRPAPGERH